jgi:hypothetical protein
MRPRFGQLAQLVEQRIENPRVRGSIPRLATKISAEKSIRWLGATEKGLLVRPFSVAGLTQNLTL